MALAGLAACSSDDNGDGGGGAGMASASTGGRPGGFGGFGATLGGHPGQGGSPLSATGGSPLSGTGGAPLSGTGGAPLSATGGSPGATGGSPPTATGGAQDPGEPTLEGLTPEELGELCADAGASFDESGATEKAGELVCRTAGIFAVVLFEPSSDEELRAACQETYDQCVAEPLDTEDECAENTMCPATVSEFQACVDEYPTYLDQVGMSLRTCSELTMDNLEQALGFEPEATPACALFWEKCPESRGF